MQLPELLADLDDVPSDLLEEAVFDAFVAWAADQGLTLYPAQEEAVLEVAAGSHVVLATPTGSGKSLVALGAHFSAMARGVRSYYTAPIKALVSEKFFALCAVFGAENVGMLTGDAAVNADAPIICATAEIAELGWTPTRTDLHTIVRDAWAFTSALGDRAHSAPR